MLNIEPVIFLLLLLHFPAVSLGFTILDAIFAYVTIFYTYHWGSHLSPWMVHAGCVFAAGIHPSRTRLSGTFESERWNACIHRLYLGLYSHPKEFWGNGVRTHVNSKGKKIPFTGKILLRGGWNPRYCIKQDSEPKTQPTELYQPHSIIFCAVKVVERSDRQVVNWQFLLSCIAYSRSWVWVTFCSILHHQFRETFVFICKLQVWSFTEQKPVLQLFSLTWVHVLLFLWDSPE